MLPAMSFGLQTQKRKPNASATNDYHQKTLVSPQAFRD